MTVPYERTMALLRTRDLLIELATGADSGLEPTTLSRRAAALLKHYPQSIHVERSASALPDIWAAPNSKWNA